MFGAVVELILFWVLVLKAGKDDSYLMIIKDAILGSILANLLLCLGLCFFVGGLRHPEQEFHGIVSEVGNGLMLVAGCKFNSFLHTLSRHRARDKEAPSSKPRSNHSNAVYPT